MSKEYQAEWRKKNRKKVREYARKWHAENKERYKEKRAEYYQKTKDDHKRRMRENHLKKTYGITLEQMDEMLTQQNSKCAICKTSLKKRRPCVDHCHQTNAIRGLLCRSCNLKLAVVEDKWFCEKANQYLTKVMK